MATNMATPRLNQSFEPLNSKEVQNGVISALGQVTHEVHSQLKRHLRIGCSSTLEETAFELYSHNIRFQALLNETSGDMGASRPMSDAQKESSVVEAEGRVGVMCERERVWAWHLQATSSLMSLDFHSCKLGLTLL